MMFLKRQWKCTLFLTSLLCAPLVEAGEDFEVVDTKLSCHDQLPVQGYDSSLAEVKTYKTEKNRRFVLVRLMLKPTVKNFDLIEVWSPKLFAVEGGAGISKPKIWTGLPMSTRAALKSIQPNESGLYEFPYVFTVPAAMETLSLVVEGVAKPVNLPEATERPESIRISSPFKAEVVRQASVSEFRKKRTINQNVIWETISHPVGALLELQVKITGKDADSPDQLNTNDLMLKMNGFYIRPLTAVRMDVAEDVEDYYSANQTATSRSLLLNGPAGSRMNEAVLLFPVGSWKGAVALTHKSAELIQLEL